MNCFKSSWSQADINLKNQGALFEDVRVIEKKGADLLWLCFW